MTRLSPIDGVVCLAYLALVAGLAIASMRGQEDNEDYFVGGRRMNWLAVGRIDGGWSGLWRTGCQQGRFMMFHLEPNPLAAKNFTAANSIYSAAAFVLFMYLPGYAVAQNMIQRYVCAGGVGRGRAVVVLSAAVNAVLGLLFMLLGVALFAFYFHRGGMPTLASEDQILPHFVAAEAAGSGLMGLLLAGLFAASMSTIDSGINGVASVVVYDWLGGRPMTLRTSRLLTVVLGALVIAAALLAPRLGDNVINIINAIAGTLLGGLMAVFLLGMFVPRANSAGAILGLVSGAACLLAAMRFPGVPKWWYGAFTVFPTLLVGAAASCLFPPPPREALLATMWTRSPRQGPKTISPEANGHGSHCST